MTKRILIVDDHADLRKLIRLTLMTTPYVLHEAANGRDALQRAAETNPDLVILDVMMPGDLNGYQVCQHIKDDPTLAHTTVMLITARGQQADLEEGARVRADAYLVKPFSPIQLLDLVTQTLGEGRTP